MDASSYPGAAVPAVARWRGMELASWSSRVVAAVTDELVVIGVALALRAAFGLHVDILGHHRQAKHAQFDAFSGQLRIAWLLHLAIAATYMTAATAVTDGQTVGKRLVGIRVRRTDSKPMGAWRSFLREALIKLLLIGSIPVVGLLVFLVDSLMPLFDSENRALHDRLARTRVTVADA